MQIRYSDAELEALLADDESELVERKGSMSGEAPNAIREAICAFANDIHNHRRPGVIFVGIDDQGRPSDLPITDELLRQLADMKSDGNTVPPPSMSVERRHLAGADVAVVIVQPSDAPPVRTRGRIWTRVGPRRTLASAQDERILNERRRHLDRFFDAVGVPTATLDDLDLRFFKEEFLPRAVAQEILAANDRTDEQRLATAKMITSADDPIPTVTGILSLGHSPQDFIPGAIVQFLRFSGTDPNAMISDEARCQGSLADVIQQIDNKIQAHVRTRIDITSKPIEQRYPSYPVATLQQLVRNAVIHRSYESTAAPVSIYWFDDHIEIHSPGGPYGEVESGNFGKPGVIDYRNPNLAEAMRVMGFVQRFGFGFTLARQELGSDYDHRLTFNTQHGWVSCTLRVAT